MQGTVGAFVDQVCIVQGLVFCPQPLQVAPDPGGVGILSQHRGGQTEGLHDIPAHGFPADGQLLGHFRDGGMGFPDRFGETAQQGHRLGYLFSDGRLVDAGRFISAFQYLTLGAGFHGQQFGVRRQFIGDDPFPHFFQAVPFPFPGEAFSRLVSLMAA